MKKFVYTAFIAFWAAVAMLLALDAMRPEAPATRPETQPPETTYTLAEIARHDRAGDCWMAIEGGVFDITGYIPRHPAPADVIVAWCGREATEGMRTKDLPADRREDHSARAWRMLERYRIGSVAGNGGTSESGRRKSRPAH